MAADGNFSRREMFLGRFLRGMAEGVAEELHREVVERAVERSGQEPRDDAEETGGASRQSAATARVNSPGAEQTGVPSPDAPAAPGAPAPAQPVNWNPPPRKGPYASRPDLPPPPRIAARHRAAFHRPPGALPEPQFLAGCTRKNDCAVACPVQAIKPVPDGPAAGTPEIHAAQEACISCEDTPCITACGPGVLTLERGVRMGTAQIAPSACIAYRGVLCTTCVDRCTVPSALELVHGRPRIHANACTGCGVCHQVCPAPRNAVLLTPGID